MPDGKVITKLKYRKNDANIEVPVRLVQTSTKEESTQAPYHGKGSSPRHCTGCAFRVYFEECELPPPEERKHFIEHTDIDVIYQLVFGMLDEQHKIDWVRWVYVTVDEPYMSARDGTGMSVEWNFVYIAKLPDGREVHQNSMYGGYKIHDGRPQTGVIKNKHRGDREQTRSLIEDTEENLKALGLICDKLNEVRDKLMDFLSPGKIKKHIKGVAEMLLTAPKE